MAISDRLLGYATWRRSPSFFSLNLRTLATKLYYRQMDMDQVDQKRFQEIRRFTVDEPFGGWTQAAHFGDDGVLDPLHGADRTPPMTDQIVRWIAWAQLAMGLLLLWSALGDAPIPAVLTLP